jgi:glutaredoxin-related protein
MMMTNPCFLLFLEQLATTIRNKGNKWLVTQHPHTSSNDTWNKHQWCTYISVTSNDKEVCELAHLNMKMMNSMNSSKLQLTIKLIDLLMQQNELQASINNKVVWPLILCATKKKEMKGEKKIACDVMEKGEITKHLRP